MLSSLRMLFICVFIYQPLSLCMNPAYEHNPSPQEQLSHYIRQASVVKTEIPQLMIRSAAISACAWPMAQIKDATCDAWMGKGYVSFGVKFYCGSLITTKISGILDSKQLIPRQRSPQTIPHLGAQLAVSLATSQSTNYLLNKLYKEYCRHYESKENIILPQSNTVTLDPTFTITQYIGWKPQEKPETAHISVSTTIENIADNRKNSESCNPPMELSCNIFQSGSDIVVVETVPAKILPTQFSYIDRDSNEKPITYKRSAYRSLASVFKYHRPGWVSDFQQTLTQLRKNVLTYHITLIGTTLENEIQSRE